jgi:hypothetical protein
MEYGPVTAGLETCISCMCMETVPAFREQILSLLRLGFGFCDGMEYASGPSPPGCTSIKPSILVHAVSILACGHVSTYLNKPVPSQWRPDCRQNVWRLDHSCGAWLALPVGPLPRLRHACLTATRRYIAIYGPPVAGQEHRVQCLEYQHLVIPYQPPPAWCLRWHEEGFYKVKLDTTSHQQLLQKLVCTLLAEHS